MTRKNEAIRQKILAGETRDVMGGCFICKKIVDGMSFCFGCREFVCPDCDKAPEELKGMHSREIHRGVTDEKA